MENMNEVLDNEFDLKDQNTILKDSVKMSKEGIATWLGEFRTTHYPKRPLTDHFWGVVSIGFQYMVDVKNVLGEVILSELQQDNPKRYKNLFK